MVEQLTLNQWVLGSSPRWCTKFPVTGRYIFARCGFSLYAAVQHYIWPVGQAVKTPASHAGIGSSILPRVTNISSRLREVVMQASQKLAIFFALCGPLAQLVRATGS